jgi:hypothetical protein
MPAKVDLILQILDVLLVRAVEAIDPAVTKHISEFRVCR